MTKRPKPPTPIPSDRIGADRAIIADQDRAAGMAAASMLLDCTDQDIRLAAGEMTAQEMRTVKAVLAWRKGVIRRKAGLDD